MNRFSAAAVCLLLAAGCGDPESALKLKHGTTEATFISGATFIAGDGSPAIEEATIILDGDEIAAVDKKGILKPPKGSAQKVGLEGHFIMPMMINLSGNPGLSSAGDFDKNGYSRDLLEGDLNRYAYYGVAAVAAGADEKGLSSQVRDEQKSGKATGAQLFTSGRGIAAKGGSGILGDLPILVTSETDGQKAVGELADLNVDFIMLWANGMKPATAAAIVEGAHQRKLKVFADAPGLAEAKAVVGAGVDALVGSVRDDEVDDALISAMKEKKVAYAPALSSLEARFILTENPRWRGESLMQEVYPPALSSKWGQEVFLNGLKRDPQTEVARKQYNTAKANLKKVAAGGVTIAFSSASGLPLTLPGYFEHHELELMVGAGLSASDVLKAASMNSGAVLGSSTLGALTPGKKANFLIVADNPAKDITASKSIDEVWINGKQTDRVELKRKYTVNVKRLTQDDINKDRDIRTQEAIKAIEDKMEHYGNKQFVLSEKSTAVTTGLSFFTPRHSKVSQSGGPPFRVSISMPGAKGDDLHAFYKETLGRSWSASGNCFDKPVPGNESKKFHLCTEPSAGQIILNINVQ
jgi:imidazolonepropionase-like amidohydrolase